MYLSFRNTHPMEVVTMLFSHPTPPMVGPSPIGRQSFGRYLDENVCDYVVNVMEDGTKVLVVTDGELVLRVTVK